MERLKAFKAFKSHEQLKQLNDTALLNKSS